MNLNLTRLLFILTLTTILWDIIYMVFTGGNVIWQIVAFIWCIIAMLNTYELHNLKNKLEE